MGGGCRSGAPGRDSRGCVPVRGDPTVSGRVGGSGPQSVPGEATVLLISKFIFHSEYFENLLFSLLYWFKIICRLGQKNICHKPIHHW